MFLGRSFTGHLLTTKGSPLVSDGEDILGWRLPASRLFGAKLLPGSIIASESALHVELHKVRLRKHLRELRLSEFTWMHHVHDTSAAKKKRKSPAPMCQAALDEWKQRQCENLRSPAHLPSAVLEDGVCCSMCFRWLRYPVSALRSTAAATHLSAFQEHCRVITRQPFRNGGRSTSHLQRDVRQHGTRYGGPCITNHWVSYKYITKCPPQASIVHPAWR